MLKYFAVFLISTALFLPLSSCRTFVTSNGAKVHHLDKNGNPILPGESISDGAVEIREIAKRGTLPSGIKSIREYNYYLEEFNTKNINHWMIIIPFLWPLLFLLPVLNSIQFRKIKLAYYAASLLLIWTSYILHSSATLGERFEVGYWTTLLGSVLFAIHSARKAIDSLALNPTSNTKYINALHFVLFLLAPLGIPIYLLIRINLI